MIDSVRIFACRTDGASTEAESYARLLPPEAVARARRLRSPAARAEALVAAAFLRSVLASEVGTTPAALRLTSHCRWCGDGAHGKPTLAGPDAPSLHFNLSHTPGLALLAVSTVEVGVDVERVGGADVTTGSELVLTTAEQASLATQPTVGGVAYLELFTRKESYLKGVGVGLVRDPREVTFEPGGGRWSVVLDHGRPTPWRSCSLGLKRQWIGALAVASPQATVRWQTWPASAPPASPRRRS